MRFSYTGGADRSVEEAKNLATGLLSAGLLVVHDAVGGGHDHVAELAGRQEVGDVLVDGTDRDVEARGDDPALVDAAGQVDNELVAAVVVYDLELTNVAVLLHALQELDDHLGARTDEDLALSALLGVVDRLQRVRECSHTSHGGF